MGFLSLITSFFSVLSLWLTGKKEESVSRDNLILEQKKESQNTIIALQKQNEVVNAEPKTSYDGDPHLLSRWLQQHRKREE